MIDDTLQKLEARIAHAEHLSPENRESLNSLLAELRQEVQTLQDTEHAESITGFADHSTREALRSQPDAELRDHAISGLQKSVRNFEASHPSLTAVVNGICQQLSNLGI